MPIAGYEVWALVAVLVAIAILLTIRLARRPAVPAADPAVLLLQQEITRLAEQIARVGARIPQEVGASLTQMSGQMAQRLSENAQSLQKASADTGRLIADINLRLGELGRGSQEILALGQDIRGLQQIFQAPKIRGGLGEIALAALLQQSFPAGHYALQHAFQDGQTVDAVLRLPGGLVPIDSKFPLAGFRLLLEAAGAEQKTRARRQFAREVRKHIDDIAEKYRRPSEGTLDFALMYVPAENVFYEMITSGEGEEDLGGYAQQRRVIPVSPNSIFAYLQALAYGLMGLQVEERARDILKGLQQLQGDFATFRDAFDLGMKHLRNAQVNLGDADRQSDRLGDKIRQFASVAGSPAEGETLPAAPVPVMERYRPRGLES